MWYYRCKLATMLSCYHSSDRCLETLKVNKVHVENMKCSDSCSSDFHSIKSSKCCQKRNNLNVKRCEAVTPSPCTSTRLCWLLILSRRTCSCCVVQQPNSTSVVSSIIIRHLLSPYIIWHKVRWKFPGSWIHRASCRVVVWHDFRWVAGQNSSPDVLFVWIVQIILNLFNITLQQSRTDGASHSLQSVFPFALVLAACAAELSANAAANEQP